MRKYRIPLNRPFLVGCEFDLIADALKRGQVSGDGFYSKKCHAFLEERLGVKKALLTTSCTHALEMAALLLPIAPGDEVILPSFTFVSTANAFVLRGARPVFIDIRPDTLNMDEKKLEPLINSRTRAIVPVHYAGVGCEMDPILETAKRHGVAVVEDNAHGLFGKYGGRWLGSFGDLATLSFHETKNVICGEGGALIVNDEKYIERAEILREKGTNRSRFFRGEVDKYTWVDVGSSYLPSDILAAFLYAQMEAGEEIQSRRRRIWETYRGELEGWAEANGVTLPSVPPRCEQAYHMFYMLLPSLEKREALISLLRERGILATFHYIPLHLSPMGRKWGYGEGDLPVTESVSERLIRLPFYNAITEAEVGEVCSAVKEVDNTP